MKKILLAGMVLLITSGVSFATITVKEARSAEQLKKEGFSGPVIENVQREAGEFNPRPTNRYQRFGFKIWNYLDPSSPEPRDKEPYNIRMYSGYEDL